jgi:excisionase family DNA binding protein
MTDSDSSVIGKVWLSPVEIGEMTGVSRTEIYLALQTGDLKGHQRIKGGAWRVHLDAVNAWMRGERMTA